MNEINRPEQKVDPRQRFSASELRSQRSHSSEVADRLDSMDAFPVLEQRESKGLSEAERAKINSIVERHYDKARQITEKATKNGEPDGERDYLGANFTDHNEAHIKQVEEKTTEALGACVDAIKAGKLEQANATGDVHFSDKVDFSVTQAAALSHDTGMSNELYSYNSKTGTVEKQNSYDFSSVRNNHCINSALNVLANRDQYKEAGFSDTQINDIAMLTFSHSKTNSGIEDLNNSEDWKKGIDKLSSFIERYNFDHPDKKISFDEKRYENKENLSVLATEALALRVGDVSRDSGPDALAQSGEAVHVDKASVGEGASYQDEVENAVVLRGEEPVDSEQSKQVHIGEQNIIENHTAFDGDHLVHTIKVNDGNYAPFCTSKAIKDHFGEFASAYNINSEIVIQFEKDCGLETRAKYEDARKEMYHKQSEKGSSAYVKIRFPWEKE